MTVRFERYSTTARQTLIQTRLPLLRRYGVHAPRGRQPYTRYNSERDEVLLAVLQNRAFYHLGIVGIVSAIWKSRGYRLPANTPEPEDTETASYPLTKLCASGFYFVFEIVLWILLVGGIIGGGIIGHSLIAGIGIIIGAIIGCVIAFVIMLEIGGLIAVFLKINENVEKLGKKGK